MTKNQNSKQVPGETIWSIWEILLVR